MRKRLLGATLLPLVATATMAATLAPEINITSGSRVWAAGTSTVRAWRCETARVEGSANGAGSTAIADLDAVRNAEISLTVASLDCRNETMNGHMRRALKSDEAAAIRFRATSVSVTPSGDGQAAVRMSGPLSIAGQDKTVTIDATAVREANGALRVRGSKQINMTEWGVRPPSLMMGTMKVAPGVTIGFDVLLTS
ncbi:MAG TPA: YceI family protein [Longimicrobium sp.]|nr:YceI family protein [Longimicrobium sp.]